MPQRQYSGTEETMERQHSGTIWINCTVSSQWISKQTNAVSWSNISQTMPGSVWRFYDLQCISGRQQWGQFGVAVFYSRANHIRSTPRSWLHLISTIINVCPLDWRTTIHWNFVLAIFQHIQDCSRSFEYMVILNSREQGPKKMKTMGQIFPVLSTRIWTLSLDWRINIHSNVDLVFLQQSWHIWLCWKIARTTFQCMVVLQSRGQNDILVEI